MLGLEAYRHCIYALYKSTIDTDIDIDIVTEAERRLSKSSGLLLSASRIKLAQDDTKLS